MNDRPYGLLVMLSPTTRCNLSCKYCYVPNQYPRTQTDMTPSELEEAYAWIRDYAALLNVDNLEIEWFGGEPLLAGIDFLTGALELQKKIFGTELHIINRIQTNFTLITPKYIPFIKRYFDGYISGSYDFGSNARVFRGGNNASYAIRRKIIMLRKTGIRLGVVCTLTKSNVKKIKQIYCFFRKYGIDFRVNRATSMSDNDYGDFISNDEYVDAVKRLFDLYTADQDPPMVFSNFTMMVKSFLNGDAAFCVGNAYPEYHIAMEAAGRVFSRCRIRPQIGNFHRDSPSDIIKIFSESSRDSSIPPRCRECKYHSTVCEGTCFGEPSTDCLHSNCGYRGETSLELWKYIDEFLTQHHFSMGQFKESAK